MSAAQKDDTLKGAATGSPEGASPVDENVEEAIEAEVIEEPRRGPGEHSQSLRGHHGRGDRAARSLREAASRVG